MVVVVVGRWGCGSVQDFAEMIVSSRQSKKKKKRVHDWTTHIRLLEYLAQALNQRWWYKKHSAAFEPGLLLLVCIHRPPGSQIDLLRQVRNTGRADWTPWPPLSPEFTGGSYITPSYHGWIIEQGDEMWGPEEPGPESLKDQNLTWNNHKEKINN